MENPKGFYDNEHIKIFSLTNIDIHMVRLSNLIFDKSKSCRLDYRYVIYQFDTKTQNHKMVNRLNMIMAKVA